MASEAEWSEEEAAVQRECWSHGFLLNGWDEDGNQKPGPPSWPVSRRWPEATR